MREDLSPCKFQDFLICDRMECRLYIGKVRDRDKSDTLTGNWKQGFEGFYTEVDTGA